MISSSRSLTRAARVWFELGRAAEFFSNLQIWQLVTLKPVDLQRSTVPLWKNLKLGFIRLAELLRWVFALSKWPHLQLAYLVRVKSFDNDYIVNSTIDSKAPLLTWTMLIEHGCRISWWGKWNSIDFNSLMNMFKGLFDILSHHLIEGLRSQKLLCIIANLFLGLWSNGAVNFYQKTK